MKVLKWVPGTDSDFDALEGCRPDYCRECGRAINGDPVIFREETYHLKCLAQKLEREGLR